MSNETCLVFLNCAICLLLDAEYPFGSNNILMCWFGDITPCACLIERGYFRVHCLLPVRPVSARLGLSQCLQIVLNFLNESGDYVTIIILCRIIVVSMCTCSEFTLCNLLHNLGWFGYTL